MLPRPLIPSLLALLLLVACAPAATRTESVPASDGGSRAPAPAAPKRLTVPLGNEARFLAAKFESNNTFALQLNYVVNSPLAVKNVQGIPLPLLAAELPSQDAGTWTVHPDGTMTTTWKIRPGARWHDGVPITAKDFDFAFRVYTDATVPLPDREPERYMERVEVRDPATFVIHWKQPYARANELITRQLEPLPEHQVGDLYAAGDPEAFLNHSFWVSPAYVGTGPFRLVEWDPGNQLTYRAFDGYFMGRPPLDEVVFKIIPDINTVVANLLSGTVDVTVGASLTNSATRLLISQWADGQVVTTLARFRWMQFQFDPARNRQPALLDVRVRRAVAHGLDRGAIAEAFTEGFAPEVAEAFVPHTSPLYARVDQAIAKYPYDPNRAGTLLAEAGWTRRGDTLVNASGQPLTLEMWATGSGDEMQANLIASDLRKLGMELALTILPSSRLSDFEYRAQFGGLTTTATSIDIPGLMRNWTTSQCPVAERRFAGNNRGCWFNAEFERLYEVASTSLDPTEGDNAVVQGLKVLTDELGILGLNYDPENIAVRKGVVGPGLRWPGQFGSTWNIHEWRWESGLS